MLKKQEELPLVSITLGIVNILVFLICTFTGDLLYNKGGLEPYHVLYMREYQRVIWAMFLHADVQHLSNNMIILIFMGAMIEKEIGHIRYMTVYFLSGIGGNVVSLMAKVVNGENSVSIGASGAIFGLDGLLLAMVLFSGAFRSTVTPRRVIFMIFLSLYGGFTGGNVDNAAHVGGLIVGFLAGAFLCLVARGKQKKIQM